MVDWGKKKKKRNFVKVIGKLRRILVRDEKKIMQRKPILRHSLQKKEKRKPSNKNIHL